MIPIIGAMIGFYALARLLQTSMIQYQSSGQRTAVIVTNVIVAIITVFLMVALFSSGSPSPVPTP